MKPSFYVSWSFEEHWYGEVATKKVGGLEAKVQMLEGHGAHWCIKIDGETVSEANGPMESFTEAFNKAEAVFNAHLMADGG